MDEATGAPDLAAVFDEHMKGEFVDRSVEGTMATMTARPYTYFLPTMRGGVDVSGVADYYRDHFIGKVPADFAVSPVSRTVGTDRLVDEFVVSFTHDVEMDFILPGVTPTTKHVDIPVVVVVNFEGTKIASEHVYWDQAAVLLQVGLLDGHGLPVSGAEQAAGLRQLVAGSKEAVALRM